MTLRLGVAAAIFDDEERLLLSQRADLAVWALPGGRLDMGEWLADAAAREVREETGVVVQVERAVGLYYQAGWQRMNVLFAGWPLGGSLAGRTAETRANRYFARHELPATIHDDMVRDALSATLPPPRVITLPPDELRRVRQRLRMRWVANLLRGRPEPKYPRFDVRAVGVLRDGRAGRVLTVAGRRGRALPRIRLSGVIPPWTELADAVAAHYGPRPALRWAGVWSDPARGLFEFVFAAKVAPEALSGGAEWSTAQNIGLGDRDALYVAQVGRDPADPAAPVWLLTDPDDDVAMIAPRG